VHVDGALTYDKWCDGVRRGRSYVSDGYGHLIDFTANGVAVGERDLELDAPSRIVVRARAACLLPEAIPTRPDPMRRPYWTPEHARAAGTRAVTIEVVVNGQAAGRQQIVADGTIREVELSVPIARSSWVALRIPGCAHTNPIFVTVGGASIRASRKSADWCLRSVDQCWSQKAPRIRARERDAARNAYEHARARYRAIAAESSAD
jgi:hypothetical protein